MSKNLFHTPKHLALGYEFKQHSMFCKKNIFFKGLTSKQKSESKMQPQGKRKS